MKKDIYPLDFLQKDQHIELLKNNLPNDIKIDSVEEKSEFQIFLRIDPNNHLILYCDSNAHYQLDLTQCPGYKQKIFETFKQNGILDDCSTGIYKSNMWILKGKDLALKLKEELIKRYITKLKDTGSSPKQNFMLKIKGKNSLTHMKNGQLYLNLPYPNRLTDKIYKFVNDFVKENEEINYRKFKELDIPKESYETFLHNNFGLPLAKKVDKNVYNYLYGKDIWELEDGIKLFHATTNNSNLQLKNYKALVRPFSIVFEGFLIKYFIEIGILDKKIVMNSPFQINLSIAINDFRKEYGMVAERLHQGIVGKIANAWKECRNNYFHADIYSISRVLDKQDAEDKILFLFSTMKEMLELLLHLNGENTETKSEIFEKSI